MLVRVDSTVVFDNAKALQQKHEEGTRLRLIADDMRYAAETTVDDCVYLTVDELRILRGEPR